MIGLMPTQTWAPPTSTERSLHEAVARGDEAGTLDVLARGRLYVLTARLHADAPGYTAPLPSRRDKAARRTVVPVLTEGMLPPWHPEWVFRQTTLDELAQAWPDGKWWLAVNPDTPYATVLQARPAHRQAWREAAARAAGSTRMRLITHAGGHLHGPVASGLALGAHLAIVNGLAWNLLGAVYEDYPKDVARLRRPWGVTQRAGYHRTFESLLATRLVGRVAELVLRTRRGLVARLDRTPSPEEWAAGVTAALGGRYADDDDLREAADFQRRIAHYEGRFRADGLLPPDGRVDTLAAFDHGRAVNVVRLALGARYCDPAEAEQAVLRIAGLARQAYGSWADFSLGYLLARLIHFDEGDPEGMYQECLALHRTLIQDPASPYRNIPWS